MFHPFVRQVKDPVGERVQKLFQDFLERCRFVDEEPKYLKEAKELIRPERNTLTVSFDDVQNVNHQLASTIIEEYYRLAGWTTTTTTMTTTTTIHLSLRSFHYTVTFIHYSAPDFYTM